MIIILTISSALHLVLGYALAVYLHGERSGSCRCSGLGGEGSASHRSRTSIDQTTPAFGESPWLAYAADTNSEAKAGADKRLFEDQQSDVDQTVLAGIQEFRSQLARLKAQRPSDEPPGVTLLPHHG